MNNVKQFLRGDVKLYAGDGRKCLYCVCCFSNSFDLHEHMKTHWVRTKSGNGEILHASLDPILRSKIENERMHVEGGYRYVLLGQGPDQKIFRTRGEGR